MQKEDTIVQYSQFIFFCEIWMKTKDIEEKRTSKSDSSLRIISPIIESVDIISVCAFVSLFRMFPFVPR